MNEINADHVVIRGEKIICLSCGGKQTLSFPVPMDLFSMLSRTFIEYHKECKKGDSKNAIGC